jgi:predicted house-cleaning noncanonical NTP pyrophosphatase (MazG superfamily)
MLREIISEILVNSNSDIDLVFVQIKDTAKSFFYSGKITVLKDFIFDIPNEKSEDIKQKLTENLDLLLGNSDEFIQQLKSKIQEKVKSKNMDKNLDSLLDILDYGHLKDMLKMFSL